LTCLLASARQARRTLNTSAEAGAILQQAVSATEIWLKTPDEHHAWLAQNASGAAALLAQRAEGGAYEYVAQCAWWVALMPARSTKEAARTAVLVAVAARLAALRLANPSTPTWMDDVVITNRAAQKTATRAQLRAALVILGTNPFAVYGPRSWGWVKTSEGNAWSRDDEQKGL